MVSTVWWMMGICMNRDQVGTPIKTSLFLPGQVGLRVERISDLDQAIHARAVAAILKHPMDLEMQNLPEMMHDMLVCPGPLSL